MKQCSNGHAWESGELCNRCNGADINAPQSIVEDQDIAMEDTENKVEESTESAPLESEAESSEASAPAEESAPAEDSASEESSDADDEVDAEDEEEASDESPAEEEEGANA